MNDPTPFVDLGAELLPALLQALSARGYESATPVQAAVLAPAAHGRDLLVSSQTGSGKTIAFGAALAATLLDAASASPPVARVAGAPRALVIVPTRELAAQVREELGWLLAGAPLRLGSFTGGTAVSGDLRALHRGVDVAIGTPGRLVDLMRREKLVLGQLQVVVLDEADEMLDLGFREDLETLLGAAPVERRTLLLSATLPSEIRALARRFQRDAMAIDPRQGGPAARPGAGAHDDIAYLAHLIAGGDRLAAVVNLLRASPDARAIVFCTTRDGVGALHRELMARGFAATAISGERAQAERDRALDQVRQGEARILVATNVAARGLHLPDVDLIIHADLPLNAESLTHRSGRTGRAGRKGTAVVLASLGERRKAERLLSIANIRVAWTAPPSAKQIAAASRTQLFDALLAEAADGTTEADGDTEADNDNESTGEDPLAAFRGKLSVEELARRLLAREMERLPSGEKLQPVMLPSADANRRFGRAGDEPPSRRREPGDFAREGVRFRVNLGGKDQADPRWLLPLICRRGGVTRREVGAIRIGPQETIFEISSNAAAEYALAAAETDPRAPHVRVERIDGPVGAAHSDERPPRAAKPAFAKPYAAKPAYAKSHAAKPAFAKPHTAEPAFAKPHTAEPAFAKPHTAKPAFAEPHTAEPAFAKSHTAKPAFAKPHTAKPAFAKSHTAKPAFAKPHTAKPAFAKPHAAKLPFAKSHAARPHTGSPPAGSLGGERPYKRPHAAEPDRFKTKPRHPHAHPTGKHQG